MPLPQVTIEQRVQSLWHNRAFLAGVASLALLGFGVSNGPRLVSAGIGNTDPDRPQKTAILPSLSFGLVLLFCGLALGKLVDRQRRWPRSAAPLAAAAVVLLFALVSGNRPDPALGTRAMLGLAGCAMFVACVLYMLLDTWAALARNTHRIQSERAMGAGVAAFTLGALAGSLALSVATVPVLIGILSATAILAWLPLARTARARAVLPAGTTDRTRPDAMDRPAYLGHHRRLIEIMSLGALPSLTAGVLLWQSGSVSLFSDGSGASLLPWQATVCLAVGVALGALTYTIVGETIPIKLAVAALLAGTACWLLLTALAVTFRWNGVLAGVLLVGVAGHGGALLVTILATLRRAAADRFRARVTALALMLALPGYFPLAAVLGYLQIPITGLAAGAVVAATAAMWFWALVHAWRRYFPDDVHPIDTRIVWTTIGFYARFWCRMKLIGPCTIPARGPVMVVANHTTGIDPMLLLGSSPHRLPAFIIAEEFYRLPVLGYIIRMAHCVPVQRDNPSKTFLAQTLKLLRDGGLLVVFPQGGFTGPGESELIPKTGAAAIALRTGATVIPCHISGTVYRASVAASYFRRHNARMRYGKRIDLSAYQDRAKDREAQQEVTELFMQRIFDLAPTNCEPAKAAASTP